MSPRVPDTFYVAAPKLNEFNILSLVSGNSRITQAELARRCALSVAMVNNYMKSLCSRGLLEYHRKTTKSVTYHLTTQGRDWIATTEKEMISDAVELFEQIKNRIREAIERAAPKGVRRVVIYGTGTLAEIVYHSLEQLNPESVSFCDDGAVGTGRELCGCPVLPFSQIADAGPDTVVLTGGVHAGDANGTWSLLASQGIFVVRMAMAEPAIAHLGSAVPVWLPQALPAGRVG